MFVKFVSWMVGVAFGIVVCSTSLSTASVLSNGNLTVQVLDSNGAISSATFGGSEFFAQGVASAISDFGFQNGADIDTFRRNDAYGNTDGIVGVPVTVSANNVVTGTYTGGGAQVLFARSYSLLSGLNVLRISTNLTNQGGALQLSYFDTFDPDQGVDFGLGYETYNYVFPLAGGTVGQARIDGGVGRQHTVLGGSLDSRVTVAAGYPFSIFDGYDLNDFFDMPFNGQDTYYDGGIHLGIRTNLAAGQTTNYTFDLAFGLTPASAQQAFTSGNPLPEPSTFVLAGLGLLGILFTWRRGVRRR